MLSNSSIIGMVKDITIAKLSNTDSPATKENGEKVAEFMQVIYDKISELNSDSNQ